MQFDTSNWISKLTLLAILLAGTQPVEAGSILSENLPKGTTIVNIDGKVDGTAGHDDKWVFYGPFSKELKVDLPAGTYRFQVINKEDAAKSFPSLTPEQLKQVGEAWTFNSPWQTNYQVFTAFKPDARAIFAGACSSAVPGMNFIPGGYGSSAEAYKAAREGHYADKIWITGKTDPVSTYSFESPTTLYFGIGDDGLYDNKGVLSLVVSPANVASAAPVIDEQPTRTTISFSSDILFDYDKFALLPAATDALTKITNEQIKRYPDRHVIIQGHTDDRGAAMYNVDLSCKRATAVATWLSSNGVSATKMEVTGFGASRPKVPNDSDINRQLNRRVEIVLADDAT